MWGISWLAANQLASQEGARCKEWMSEWVRVGRADSNVHGYSDNKNLWGRSRRWTEIKQQVPLGGFKKGCQDSKLGTRFPNRALTRQPKREIAATSRPTSLSTGCTTQQGNTLAWSPYFSRAKGTKLSSLWHIQQFSVLPTQCICVFSVALRTNSDYFPIQH